jgi:hypothetical protein
MSNYVSIAKKYCEAGYSVIPITSNKVPAIKEWKEFQSRPMTAEECERHFTNTFGIALLCGVNNVTAMDFDLKYDLSKDLFERFKSRIPKDLLKKMYVQSTRSKGYHFAFACDKLEGNQKLACRYTTDFEKHQTYMDNFNNPQTRSKALKIAQNDKSRVLIETRGKGGYICINPTPGYKNIYGKLTHITEDEYDILMSIAREFNEVREVKKDIRLSKYDEWKLSPFADFNERGDTLMLLGSSGWSTVGRQHGKSVRLKRPGQIHSNSSALYDVDSRILNIFSTSTMFDVGRGYMPVDIFIELEAGGDVSLAFRKLVDQGYGKK